MQIKNKYIGRHWFERFVEKNHEYLFLSLTTDKLSSKSYCFTPEGQKWWKASDEFWEDLQQANTEKLITLAEKRFLEKVK